MAQSQQSKLPREVDVLKFSHQSLSLEGAIALKDLSRLCALLEVTDSDEPVKVSIQFALDENKHRVAEGSISAVLSANCQRCMQDMPVVVEQSFQWGFAWDDEKAKALPRNLDPVLIDPESSTVDLYETVEDELLLALPMTYFHEQCGDGDRGAGKQFGEVVEPVEADNNPFQVLKDLNIDVNKTRKS